MQKIKTQVSKILNKYLDIMLYTYRPLQSQKQGFNPDLLEPMAPVLFRVKSTGINYGFHLFQLGLLQTTTRQGIRNSRNLIVKGTKNNKIKLFSISKQDIIPLNYNAQNINVTDQELIELGLSS